MIVTHLSLANFRNYSALELDLPRYIAIFQGGNAQGKSNLLEALHILATTRSHRTANEKELINWAALQEPLPVCRLAADVEKAGRKLSLEIAFRPTAPAPGEPREPPPQERRRTTSQAVQKRIRVNGIVRRAVDLVGQVNAVLFTAQDIEVVGGEPALRRRYLDVMNSQIDPQYLRLLQRYQRVLWQRNRLLHLIAQNQARPDELSFWDQELVRTGSYLIEQRERAVAALDRQAEAIHREVSGEQENLTLVYIKSIEKDSEPSRGDAIPDRFAGALQAAQSKELAQGMSLVGPHRDDLRFLSNGNDVGVFGSRGQQRTVALSMRLAEARFITERTGDQPVLLLDDVLSELDAPRRQHLLSSVAAYQQVLMTTTELEPFDPVFLEKAVKFRVSGGHIEPLPR